MLINLDSVDLYYSDRLILKDVTLSVHKGDKIGLVGANGTGKTTLLNVICGVLTPDNGSVTVTRDVKIGYLRQNSGLDRSCTVIEEMESVFSRVFALRKEMNKKEEMMTVLSGAGLDAVAEEYNRLQDEFNALEGFSVPVKIRTVLTGMDFVNRDNDIISNLSGGEKTRLALAKLLLENPDVLVLDEPTNHLDFKTLMWLEDYLEDYSGALITVSHDRYFLDKRCTKIWEVEDNEVTVFRGNYSAYKPQKEERVKAALREYERETARIVSMREYAERNIARASTSNMAKSRLHQLEHIKLPEKPRTSSPAPRFAFSTEILPVKDVLDVRNTDVTVADGAITLVKDLSFHVLRGDRLAVIGANGTGKTTLMRKLFYSKENAEQGITFGRNTSLSFFEQENDSFIDSNTVMDELWRRKKAASPQHIRDALGRMLFSGEDVFKPVSVLSGGEKARLSFAILAEEKANVLLLDEPTNHLDLNAREALEKAAKEYDGTLIFVSHDRYFINALATHILELREDGYKLYQGNFDDYLLEKKKEEVKKTAPVKTETEGKTVYHRSKQQRAEEAKRKKRIAELEELISKSEAELTELNDLLSSPEIVSDFEKVNDLCTQIEELRLKNEAYMEEWMELND